MKRWQLIAIALSVYALVLVVTAPATLVDAGLQRLSQGRLRLAEAQGTLWSGSGQIEVRDAGGHSGVAKSITWRILPLSLLRGQLFCEVKLEQAAKPFPVTLSFSRVELANADISLPASALGLGVPKLAPLGLTGAMVLHVSSFSIERNKMQGKATLQWRDAGSVLTPVSPLGDYEVNLNGEGATVNVVLSTLKGPLQLDGKGSLGGGRSPDFLAIARVPPEYQQQLSPLMRLIAVERSTGSFELQLR